MRKLIGGGPQGALWGILEYLSQSNGNTDYVRNDRKFKFIDDLSILEMINILSIGITSYNFKIHVPSDILVGGYYIPNENTQNQDYLNKISKWTSENKMELNQKKSQAMIFNFTKQFQFTSRTKMNGHTIDVISETKLLGVMINNKLTWDSNTLYLVRRANARMRLLHKLVDFGVPTADLVNIYTSCM